MYVSVKELPDFVQAILKDKLGYRKKDIAVQASDSVSPHGISGDGYRAFMAVVNMGTKKHEIKQGSWGGPNVFNPQNAIDLDTNLYKIPVDGMVIKGTEGGGHPVWATITVHPDAMPKLLSDQSQDKLSPQHLYALHVYSTNKSSYRKQELQRYNISDSIIDELIEMGYLKRAQSGATQITTKGKNAAPDNIYDIKKQLSISESAEAIKKPEVKAAAIFPSANDNIGLASYVMKSGKTISVPGNEISRAWEPESKPANPHAAFVQRGNVAFKGNNIDIPGDVQQISYEQYAAMERYAKTHDGDVELKFSNGETKAIKNATMESIMNAVKGFFSKKPAMGFKESLKSVEFESFSDPDSKRTDQKHQ